MIKYLLVSIFFLSICLYAQEEALKTSKDKDIVENRDISERFQLGKFLVYDCINSNWICTRKEEYNRCKDERSDAFSNYKKNLVCAYFNEYKTTKDCQKVQQQMVDRGLVDKFCQNDDKSIL